MNKSLRMYVFFIVIMITFTACQSPFSKGSQKSNSQNNAKKTNQNVPGNAVANSNISTNNSVPMGNLVNPGNFSNPIKSSLVIQNGSFLYYSNWSDGDKIYKINVNGTGIQKISDDSAPELILSNNILYYSNESDAGKLYVVNIDGTGRKKLLNEKAYNLDLLGNLIYFIDSNNNISTLDINSGKKVQLNIKSRVFDSDGTNIYYEDYLLRHALSSIKIDGSNYGKVCDDAPMSIVSQSGVVYYTNGWDNNKIYKISSDGSNKVKLNDYKSSNLVIDNGWIYYINNSDFDKIYKIKTDGSSNTLVSSESFVKYFSIAGNFVFFNKNTNTNPSIYKINK